MGADFRWPACGPVLMCVISATGSTTKEMRLNKLTSIQKSNNIASHLGTPGFMTSWSCMLKVLSASLLKRAIGDVLSLFREGGRGPEKTFQSKTRQKIEVRFTKF